MNCQDLAAQSVKAVRDGKLKIVPEFHHQTWYHWLDNIQEWCISRQLWWGHRIPAYKVVKPAQKEEVWFTGHSLKDAEDKAKKKLGVKSVELEQDEDVLDTWFSSGLFPFSVMGWPNQTPDMEAFFPTSLLETGHDILFFWVARMVMMSIGLTGKLPFETVYLHVNRVVGYRHFCNKVWQGTKFGLMYFGEGYKFPGAIALDLPLQWEDRRILSKLSACAKKANEAFEAYQFADATTACHSFFQYELCDVYLELLKPRFYGELSTFPEAEQAAIEKDRRTAREVLYVCLDYSMRLMHPLLPYLTEELYQRLPPSPNKCASIVVAPYPTHVCAWVNAAIEEDMLVVAEIAAKFRSQKTSLELAPSARPGVCVRHSDPDALLKLKKLEAQIGKMGSVGAVQVLAAGAEAPKGALRDVVNEKCLIFMDVSGVDLTKQIEKLEKKLASSGKMADSYVAKMAVPGYVDKVPESIRETNATKLEACKKECEEFRTAIAEMRAAAKR